jgi:hypothetical protein
MPTNGDRPTVSTPTETSEALQPVAPQAATHALVARARQMLVEAQSLTDLRVAMEAAGNAQDGAKRLAKLAEASGMTTTVVREAEGAANDAAAVRIEAEAMAGEILRDMKEHGQRHAGQGGDQRSRLRADTVTLKELGVSKSESKRWQGIAAIPVEVRTAYVEATKDEHGEVSAAGLMRRQQVHVVTFDGDLRPQQVHVITSDGDLRPQSSSPEPPRPATAGRQVYHRYLQARDGLLGLKPEPVLRAVTESIIRRDLAKIRAWCDKVEAALTGN